MRDGLIVPNQGLFGEVLPKYSTSRGSGNSCKITLLPLALSKRGANYSQNYSCLAGASWADLDEIIHTLDLLQGRVVKAELPNPFTEPGFDAWIARLERAASRTIGAAERKQIREGAKLALRDWQTMTAAGVAAAITVMVDKMFRVPAAKITGGAKALAGSSGVLVKRSKVATAAREKLTIATTFDAVDKEMLAFTRSATEHFVRDRYGAMKALHSQVARDHVAAGIRQGYSSRVIGEGLQRKMTAMGLARSRSYWNTVSGIYAARARSWGQLRSYEQGGIQTMRFVSVLDKNTTIICRFMHGKIIQVAPAIRRYRQAFDAPPEDVKRLQPFVQLGKDELGELLYYKDGRGARRLVARVEESAAGKVDEVGRFSAAMSPAQLEAAGIGPPGLHPYCRSTTVAATI